MHHGYPCWMLLSSSSSSHRMPLSTQENTDIQYIPETRGIRTCNPSIWEYKVCMPFRSCGLCDQQLIIIILYHIKLCFLYKICSIHFCCIIIFCYTTLNSIDTKCPFVANANSSVNHVFCVARHSASLIRAWHVNQDSRHSSIRKLTLAITKRTSKFLMRDRV
jgi:hypothetical protein